MNQSNMENKKDTIRIREILGGQLDEAFKPIHPVTGEEVNLPAEHEDYKKPDYSTDGISKALAENNLDAIKEVEVKDPITGKTSLVTIDRTGHNEKKLIMALADPNMKKDTKDHYLSMYLWEKGSESASFIVDLMRHKGTHTKETRAFSSQMRFDFEMFITIFCTHLKGSVKDMFSYLKIENPSEFVNAILKDMEENKVTMSKSIEFVSKAKGITLTESVMLGLMISVRNWADAETFEGRVEKITQARMKEKGHGIYIDSSGKPYSIYEDQSVDEVVKADMERIKSLNEEK